MPSNRSLGGEGEDRAASLLLEHGFRILQRNVHLPGGEIDIVCLDGTTLVFVEVKRRRGTQFGNALAAVDSRKRAKLRSIAADYAQIIAPNACIRFDVVAIDGARMILHRNAF